MAPARKKDRDLKLLIKVSPRLTWVLPYIKKARARMPSLVLPTQIRSFRPTKTRIMRVYGNAYYETRVLVLATHTQVTYFNTRGKEKVKKIVAIPRTEILDTLAHEMAHMKYPEHGYEHEEYTRSVFKAFGIMQKCPTCKGKGQVLMESKP